MNETVSSQPNHLRELEGQSNEVVALVAAPKNEISGLVAAEQQANQITALTTAREAVNKLSKEQQLENIVNSLDLTPDKFRFSTSSNYRAEARAEGKDNYSSTVTGKLNSGEPFYPKYERSHRGHNPNEWGSNLREKAHNSGEVMERTGIRTVNVYETTPKVTKMPHSGWRGKLGMKYEVHHTEQRKIGEKYVFDYEIASPGFVRNGNEAARNVGNNTGQNVQLSMEITKEQAEGLSKLLAEDSTTARSVVDAFVSKTGDNGAWNAEIFDENGTFHDPGDRYNRELLARNVRPNYDAMPDLEPKIIGLVGVGDVVDGVSKVA